MGIIKSQSDRRALKEAGHITQAVLVALQNALEPGISTLALEALAVQLLAKHRSSAPFRTFSGFNHAICISLNQEIVNGPPSRERIIQAGDLVSIATAAEVRNIHAKAAFTAYVPTAQNTPPPEEITRLLHGSAQTIPQLCQKAQQAEPLTLNALMGVMLEAEQHYAITRIHHLGGAGIGKQLHEWPAVPNTPADFSEEIPLQPGLCFTVMPMFSLGASPEFTTHKDGWTYLTADGALSAHFADTLLMTDEGLLPITHMAQHTLSQYPYSSLTPSHSSP